MANQYGYGRRIAFNFAGQKWEAVHDAVSETVFAFERRDDLLGDLKQRFRAILPREAMRSRSALLEACINELKYRAEAREMAVEEAEYA